MNESPDEIKRRVREQFTESAADYVLSRGHASGPDLVRLLEVASPEPRDRLLDVATGGGHGARVLGPLVDRVVLADLTRPMLTGAVAFLRDSDIDGIEAVVADAEAMPFADGSFDLVTCRIAPHHFPHPNRFVAEVARILAAGGRFALIDSTVEDGAMGAFFNRFEKRRDPSHVRSLTVTEWTSLLQSEGLSVEVIESFRKRHDFADWTARSRTDDDGRAELMAMIRAAGPEAASIFETTWDDERLVSFSDEKTLFLARNEPVNR